MQTAARILERATSHHRAGRISDAERDYLEALQVEESNGDALRLLGALYIATNQLDRAVACLEQAHFVQPENAETLNNLAVALRNLGRLGDAIRRYEQALEIDPHYVQALDNLGSAYYERGKFDEAIVLHRQALRVQPHYAHAHYNLGNALREKKNLPGAIDHYERALNLKPDYLDALINLGIVLFQQGRRDEAGTRFEDALRLDPQNFRVLNNLGNVLRDRDKIEEAAVLYWRAIAGKPAYLEAHINLGAALRDMGKTADALACYEHALRLKPDSADALNNMGVLLHAADRVEAAVARYDEALCIRPDSADVKWNKALALLALGHYAEGWQLYETGLAFGKRGLVPSHARRWDGRAFHGRLLIRGEQGLGDHLQFVRYAALCKERSSEIVVQAPRSLVRLLKNCSFIDDVVTEANEKDFDYQTPMMSLPHIFHTTLATIPATPYLCVSEAARRKWAGKFAGVEGFKVGLVWAGNPRAQQIDARLIDQRRSLTLSKLEPLFALDHVRLYSLQGSPQAGQIDTLGLRGRIADFMPEVEDFLDTAALVEHLDLVISVDTSVAHLAGALGKPVWVLSRFDACWRWLRNREQNPWYPSARVFGQPAPGDWATPIAKAADALNEMSRNL